jgi:GNAT superfamily N-acetyltransferase
MGIMRSQCLPMTPAEFELLPREVGWKYEYVDGCAHIRPRPMAARLRAPVTHLPTAETGCRIRPMTEADAPGLVRAFADGFRDTVEYCDSSVAQVRRAGVDAIATFFAGRRGAFHPASRLAVPDVRPSLIAGAALVVQKPDGPFLDMLFIRHRWQRQGLATALVGAVMDTLHAQGETHLGSAYNVANKPSIAWHHKLGFEEVPDLFLARARGQVARHELRRRERLGGLTDAERLALEAEVTRWDRLGSQLAEAAFGG